MPIMKPIPIRLKMVSLLLAAFFTRCTASGYYTQELLDAKFLTQAVPYVDTVLSSQYNTLLISYNEKVEASGALQASNYRIVNTSGIALAVISVVSFDGGGISFQLTTAPQTPNIEYLLSVSNVKNLKGTLTNGQASRKFIGYNSGGGVYQDNNNGTVYFSGRNITWAKCPQDNTGAATLYNSGANNCSGGSGTIGAFKYCNNSDNTCNGGVGGQDLDGAGPGISEAFNTCAALNAGAGFAGRTSWRVPDFAELSSLTLINATPAINVAFFPGTIPFPPNFWSATSSTGAAQAWEISSGSGVITPSTKSGNSFRVRCVSSGS